MNVEYVNNDLNGNFDSKEHCNLLQVRAQNFIVRIIVTEGWSSCFKASFSEKQLSVAYPQPTPHEQVVRLSERKGEIKREIKREREKEKRDLLFFLSHLSVTWPRFNQWKGRPSCQRPIGKQNRNAKKNKNKKSKIKQKIIKVSKYA